GKRTNPLRAQTGRSILGTKPFLPSYKRYSERSEESPGHLHSCRQAGIYQIAQNLIFHLNLRFR
ncbi:MAG: hypothetical protein KAR17_11805, partial [Cyclobacteriaceae bacterium]|nr:hypothetical protein [Cyclobacteriaceae bacterium]